MPGGVSSGTGFVVAPDRVLTNQHVVDGCDRIIARTPDGRWLAAVPPAQVDARLDLALLSIPGNPGPALAFARRPRCGGGRAWWPMASRWPGCSRPIRS
jgi:S1-C subfamily serine protease